MELMKIKNIIDPVELKRDLAFFDENLDEAWLQHSGLFVSYGMKAAQAEHQMEAARNELEIVRADAYHRIRASSGFSGVKMTEEQLKAEVMRDAVVQKAMKSYNDAKFICAMGKNAVEAFRHRRDMIVQASKRAILEMETGTSFRTSRASAMERISEARGRAQGES